MLVRLFKNIFQIFTIFLVVGIIIICTLWLSGYYTPDFMVEGSEYVSSDMVTTDAEYVIPGGQSIGVSIDVEDVIVTGLEELTAEDGTRINPGLEAGLQIGDVILAIDGTEVKTASDVHRIIENTDKKKVTLKVGRKTEILNIDIIPVKIKDEGVYRLGLWVKEKTAGIGTLTFYSPSDGTFAALGHGITDPETGKVMNISEGQLLDSRIISLEEGKKGSPGELRGIFYEADQPLGRLYINSSQGIYGVAYEKLSNEACPDPVPVAEIEEIKEGSAFILTTLSGDHVEKFEIEIEGIDPDNKDNKNIIIKVTDEKLLNASGGIIQGMSGSPILQNGRLVGAVTHVLVNNPEKGYGIFAETMLKSAHSVIDQ